MYCCPYALIEYQVWRSVLCIQMHNVTHTHYYTRRHYNYIQYINHGQEVYIADILSTIKEVYDKHVCIYTN